MDFPRVDAAINLCDSHLERSSSRGTEVEAYLTRYLITVIYASYEAKIKELVAQRGASNEDERVTSFMRVAADRLCRSIKISEVAGIMGHFGGDYPSTFKDGISNEAQIAYDSIINNRQEVAHEGNMNLTFDELSTFYRASTPVLDALSEALEL
jgi:hypothetical protein